MEEKDHLITNRNEKYLLGVKFTFFFIYSFLGSYLPFLNIFLTSIGLNASQAGFITGLRTVMSLISGPLWGILADHTGFRKIVYIILCLGSILLLFPLPWVAEHVAGQLVEVSINNSTNVSLAVNTIALDSTVIESLQHRLFIAMFFTLSASAVFDVPLLGYYDSIVVNVITLRQSEKANFGFERMFGSIGFGLANFICGVVSDNYKQRYLSEYTPIFYVLLVSGMLMVPIGGYVINQGHWNHSSSSLSKRDRKSFTLVFQIIKKHLVFFITVFIMGIGYAVNYGFTFLLMEDYMNASKTIMGLTVIVISCSEVLTFPISNHVISCLGTSLCTTLGILAYSARFLLISYVRNPWLILPIQSLHCFSFALFWAAAIEEIRQTSSKEIGATMFSVLNVTHFALGSLVGNMLGGFLYKNYDGRIFFRCTAMFFAIWFFISTCYLYSYKILIKMRITNHVPGASIVALNQ